MTSKIYLSQARKLQFELSSMCNALCLGCVRTETSNYNDKKNIIPSGVYLKFETFKKIITAKSFDSVKILEFCGTIDDPLMHPEFLDFLEFAKSLNRFAFIIHTNGSLRNQTYWTSMATVLKNTDHKVLFSIDGLEDTNHIYRQKTSWDKIIENAKSFLGAGGVASWQYLIFPWNQHQVEDAKKLSIAMGFAEFMSRHDRSGVSNISLDTISLRKQKKSIPNPHRTELETINNNLSLLVGNEIECNNQNKKMYFIGFDARLWPCCFLHNGMLSTDSGKREALQKRLFDAYGSNDWNNCELNNIETILSHPFYENDLVESWESREHGVNISDRIFRCTEVCNKKTLEKLPIGTAKVLYSKEQQ